MTIIIDGDLSRPVLAKAEGLLPHAFAAASHMPPLSSRRELGKKSAGRGPTGEPHLLMWPNLSGPKVVRFWDFRKFCPQKGRPQPDPKNQGENIPEIYYYSAHSDMDRRTPFNTA
jgi:hypothetical protein